VGAVLAREQSHSPGSDQDGSSQRRHTHCDIAEHARSLAMQPSGLEPTTSCAMSRRFASRCGGREADFAAAPVRSQRAIAIQLPRPK
jgi:hypothetical protein